MTLRPRTAPPRPAPWPARCEWSQYRPRPSSSLVSLTHSHVLGSCAGGRLPPSPLLSSNKSRVSHSFSCQIREAIDGSSLQLTTVNTQLMVLARLSYSEWPIYRFLDRNYWQEATIFNYLDDKYIWRQLFAWWKQFLCRKSANLEDRVRQSGNIAADGLCQIVVLIAAYIPFSGS